MSHVGSDAATFASEYNENAKQSAYEISGAVHENAQPSNKATPSWPPRTDGPPPSMPNAGGSGYRNPQDEIYIQHQSGTGNYKTDLNIIGGKIGNAVIGNVGDVTIDQTIKTFKKGAEHQEFEITGGNFTQANLGGDATYQNEQSLIAASGGEGETGGAKRLKTFFTPEELTLHIINRGMETDQFLDLLEQEYSLTQLAYCLPKNPEKAQKMISALRIVGNDVQPVI